MNNSKLCYVASNVLSQPSAAVVCIMEMCNAFSRLGANPVLCVPAGNSPKEALFRYYGVDSDFDVMEISLPGIFSDRRVPGKAMLFSLLAARELASRDAGMVYSREPWLIFILSVLLRRTCIYESHQFRFKGRLQTCLYRTMVRRSVATGRVLVVCISNSLKKKWNEYGIDDARLFVLHDGVNLKKYLNRPAREKARELLKLDRAAPLVVYTGSLLPGKGVDVLVRCANRLPGVSFVIVGGEQEDIAKLKALAQNDNVHFTGRVPPAEVPLFQAAADILALPNTRGSVIDDVTSPLKLFEYLAAGKPVVATDIPSLLEVLRHEHTALISPAGDDSALAENIRSLLSNPLVGESLVKNAQQELEHYTWERRAGKILGLCQSL